MLYYIQNIIHKYYIVISHSTHPFPTSLTQKGMTMILTTLNWCFDHPDDNCDHHSVMTGWAAVTTL